VRVRIRDATAADLAAISAIYNATIPTTTAAWTETEETLAERVAWFAGQQRDGYPTLVADDDGTIAGFTAFGDFRDAVKWPGYRYVVELTVHIAEPYWGRGLGRGLITELLARARTLGKTQIVAAVDADNEASLRFHARLGFAEVARMPAVGYKFGRWLDLVLLQRPTAAEGAG
jgi:L-amino acid N-acyltransferase